jgi:hypothetical protein
VIPSQAALAANPKPFVSGDATAISQAVQIAPRTGGLAAAIVVGTTIAQYRDTLAQASSQAVNLGIVGTTLTVQCDKTPPTLKASQLPQPLIAESVHGDSHAVKNTAGQGSSGVVAVSGHEEVTVKQTPSAIATFDGSALVLPKLIDAAGLHNGGFSKLIPGKARIATATSQVGQLSLLNGAVVLSGMKWAASARSGTHAGRHSSFTLGGVSLAGKAMPVDQKSIASTITAIDKVLAPTGLHITLPTSVFQGGTLTETPLVIGLDNSKLGSQVINPLINALQPITNPLRSGLDGISCQFGKVLTIVDLALAALDGAGGLDLDLGGASANTDGRSYADPFGNGSQHLGGGHQILGNQGPGPTSTPSPSKGNPGSSVPLPGSQDQTTTPSSGSTPQLANNVTTSQSCSTTSRANRPSCSNGQGLAVGLIAIAAVGGIAGADFLAMRRRRRLPVVQL